MKRFLACFLLVVSAATAQAGADINLVAKGSFPTADIPSVIASRDFVVFGDGTGPSKIKAARAANPTAPLAIYVKAGGVRPSDAEWADAQPLLWKSATGVTYTHSANSWAFADLQRYPNQWAAAVVVPHIRAQITPEVDWIFVDNLMFQDPTLFSPGVPPDYSIPGYHGGTLVVLRAIRAAFPDRKLIGNGWQGGSAAGYRGEVLGGVDPTTGLPWLDGVWFECWYAKCSGKAPTAARFAQDQAALMGFVQAGKVTVVDEAGLTPYTPLWREAFGIWLATTARIGRWDNAYFNLSSPPWGDWSR